MHTRDKCSCLLHHSLIGVGEKNVIYKYNGLQGKYTLAYCVDLLVWMQKNIQHSMELAFKEKNPQRLLIVQLAKANRKGPKTRGD